MMRCSRVLVELARLKENVCKPAQDMATGPIRHVDEVGASAASGTANHVIATMPIRVAVGLKDLAVLTTTTSSSQLTSNTLYKTPCKLSRTVPTSLYVLFQ